MSDFHLFDITNSIDHELAPGTTVIGRGADCDIRLLNTNVSRRHGMFELAGTELRYSDLGSSNGSYLNGEALTSPAALRHGDELTLGDLHFAVSDASTTATGVARYNEATQLAPSQTEDNDIPAVWSESAGLEDASGTHFFADAAESRAVEDYRQGRLKLPPSGDTARLVGLNGTLSGKIFDLVAGADKNDKKPRTWKIGRDPNTVDLVIPDVSVSGQHAQLVNEGPRWKVVNWMSTNGTFVNGQKGLSTYLKSGDVIRMGGTELAFELPSRRAGKGPAAGSGLLGRFRNRVG